MLLFKRVESLKAYLDARRREGARIGFVPTMGALHAGHLALVAASKNQTDCTVCSIFVNPTQFNEASDFASYPRTPAQDVQKLLEGGCEVLFFPFEEEVYPPGMPQEPVPDLEGLDARMEGAFRPGHFQGVAQVVLRLLRIVQPHALFMGQKDFQQLAIVRHLVRAKGLPVEVVGVPTVREEDGLALSSRNVLLRPEERSRAPEIYRTLCLAREWLTRLPVPEVEKKALARLRAIPGFEPEYFEIVDGATLQPIRNLFEASSVVACTAVRVGRTRLIDNLPLREGEAATP
ncbi:MAG: pantoate--beta-alanine ligase [Bacteroidetes bacterium]|nr:MAG: pantoate--beta-alanine ligase [Bacteroidota bacterium]